MKMRMIIQLKLPAVALSAVMLAAGCSQDDAVSEREGGNGTRVPLVIATAGVQTQVTETRAATELPAGSSIGVFLDNASPGGPYVPRNNVRYDRTASDWEPELEGEGIYLKEENAGVCAYYPYSASVTDPTHVSLTPHILADGEAPLAYATTQTANAAGKSVVFSMKQAYTWLEIRFKRGNIKDDITLSEFSLSGNGLSKENVVNIVTGSTISHIPADAGILTFTGDMVLIKNDSVTRNLVLPPSDALSGGLKVSVKVKEYGNRVLSTMIKGLSGMASGIRQVVTITVNGTELGFAVELAPWYEYNQQFEAIPGIGLRLTEENVPDTFYSCKSALYAGLSNLIWADENLGTQKVNSSDRTFLADKSEYGGYYGFGGNVGCKWYKDYPDPCSRLTLNNNDYNNTVTGGWRTPDGYEFMLLTRCLVGDVEELHGRKGRWAGARGKGIFLPLGGRIVRSEGSLKADTIEVGIVGNYGTTSTPMPEFGGARPYNIECIPSTGIPTNDSYPWKENDRYSIRCVSGPSAVPRSRSE